MDDDLFRFGYFAFVFFRAFGFDVHNKYGNVARV